MNKIFKNLNIGGLLALVAVAVLTISWNRAESNNKLAAQWYQVTITDPLDPSNPSNQQIGVTIDEPTGDCAEGSTEICAVQLEVASGPTPTTMAQAESFSGVNIHDRAFKD